MDQRVILEVFNKKNDWRFCLELLYFQIEKSPQDIDANVQIIYFLHNVLLEEEYTDDEGIRMTHLLKQYFKKGNEFFSNNAEYLFFVGKFLYVGEWYFGVNDDSKLTEDKMAYKMQKKALELEPNNILFEWAVKFSLNSALATDLAEKICLFYKDKLNWLESKGLPGEYVVNTLKWNRGKFTS